MLNVFMLEISSVHGLHCIQNLQARRWAENTRERPSFMCLYWNPHKGQLVWEGIIAEENLTKVYRYNCA